MKLLKEMDISMAVAAMIVISIVTLAWRLGNWVWFRPKKLEKYLRQQGLSGNPYRFFYGDWKENISIINQAQSKPFDHFSHDVASRVMPFLRDLICSYGKNSFMWIGPIPRVNIMNPEDIKDVFLKIHVFQKVKTNPVFSKLLAPGLVSHEGDKWAKHRKIINPAFHHDKLKLMLPQVYESSNIMIENWNKLLSGKDSCEIDVWPDLQKLTCDVISRSAFGSNYEEGQLIFDLLKELAQLLTQMAQSVYIPGWRFFPTKRNKRMKQIDREIKASLQNIIQKREKAMKTGETMNHDLLGLLMESNLKEIEEKGRDKNMGLSINDVMEECRLFYFAGQETTSTLLVWTIILLAKYPNWQASARDEVLHVFGKSKPDFEGISHLKVVTMILYEVLRLYPPAIMLSRAIHEEIRIGNLVLREGIQLSLPIILIHQDSELWGDDASEFKPERFSGGVSKATKYPNVFLPFGSGPRICVGQSFALIEAKMAVASILQNFSFELSPSYSHAPHSVATLRPQYGAPLILHKLTT
ncbi:Cytochrome P450 CYP72A219 [Euphorbia peplus]|nr:Cytochrome P450 CYP72A219 [Euphorbia peplus]